MAERSYREIVLEEILVPIRVEHAHLDRSERVDDKDSRVDVLRCKVRIRHRFKPADPMTWNGCLRWGGIREAFLEGGVREASGPLEALLDEMLDRAEQEAESQGVEVLEAEVLAERMGLISGTVALSRTRRRAASASEEGGDLRSSGVRGVGVSLMLRRPPTGSERGIRQEMLRISFRAETKAIGLDERRLRGVYNYAEALVAAQALGVAPIEGTLESLSDRIAGFIKDSAARQGLEPELVEVEVEREGGSGGKAKVRTLIRP